MIFISHRGNLDNVNTSLENTEPYVSRALSFGVDVEIDVWYIDGCYWLGHDRPAHKTSFSFLLTKGLWIHAKNIQALQNLYDKVEHVFFHDNDAVTLTSSKYLWTYIGKSLYKRSIAVLPEIASYSIKTLQECSGICSDNIMLYMLFLEASCE